MPLLTRWSIRVAMAWLVAGLLTGTLYWTNVQWSFWTPLATLNPTYLHMLVVGWLTQLIFGVIYWMFPIIRKDNMHGWLVQLSVGVAYWILPRINVGERGRRTWAWAAFVVFQFGLVLALISGLGFWWPTAAVLFAPALILQLIAIILFAVHAWPRIRPAMVRAATINR